MDQEFSPRQLQVLGMVAEGKTNAAIAAKLGISPSGVHQHISRMLGALGLHARTELAVYYRWHYGIVSVDLPAKVRLTAMQEAVLRTLAENPGAQNDALGRILNIAVTTVKTHLKQIGIQLGFSGAGQRLKLIMYYIQVHCR